ncbi:hypothetical protein HID58_054140 [Brassica napus]|uniref:CASP-like protein n=1 Tax=Brassica napus TaxID=3708 RepID=A0ABQ8AHZ2_BRANA|nr:hypothetical protein HID58_054140 [Brassica napus]
MYIYNDRTLFDKLPDNYFCPGSWWSPMAMAYMSVAAIAASSESGVIGIRGEEELQWMKVCNMFGKFCNRGAGGVASAMLASFAMVLVSRISAFSLFRLYGATNQRPPNLAVVTKKKQDKFEHPFLLLSRFWFMMSMKTDVDY